jgi:putative ABC transport system permease protein
MSTWRLIWRSLTHHARAHLGVVLGAMVGSAALIGALLVGDSVRGTLRDMALARLAEVTVALDGGDRFFRDALSDELPFPAAAVANLAGTASRADGEARANNVHVIGIDDRIERVAPRAPRFTTNETEAVVLNTALASHLRVKAGDSVLLRVQKPSLLSREAPITPQQDSAVALRLKVKAIAADDEFGRFSLRASQIPPHNAFVPLGVLQQRLELGQRGNILLATKVTEREAQKALAARWQLADAELQLMPLTNASGLELRSRRVFLDPPVLDAAMQAATNRTRVLSYFVNELRSGDRTTPYSMVTAAELPWVPADLGTNDMVINQWLAEDLQIGPGASVQLRYFIIGGSKRLEERTNVFRVHSIVPLSGLYADRALMPEFPGIAKAESTENWDAGFPIEMGKIRPKDEAYWKQHRGTPKAFVSLATGQQLWGNRFGDVTAVRFPGVQNPEEIARGVMSHLTPGVLGLSFLPVREQAVAASRGSQDFGQLFLGFSFFLIVAALILMGLMFQFGLERRATEIGTLLALGFLPRHVRRVFFIEGLLLATIGGLLGTLVGVFYARMILHLLGTVWLQAVGTSSLGYHASAATYGVGMFASVIVAAVTIALVLRKQGRQPAHELLARGAERAFVVRTGRKPLWSTLIMGVCAVTALAMLGWAIAAGGNASSPAFFGAGALLLVAGIAAAFVFLHGLAGSKAAHALSVFALGIRSATRRRTRSVATVALLATGSFMVMAVAANRLDAETNAQRRSSGTGGFALMGETTLPVLHDLNTAEGRDFFGLSAQDLAGVSFVPLRVRDGDDASCLNLNRAQQPRLVGVNPDLLASRRAFTFVGEGAWTMLRERGDDGTLLHVDQQRQGAEEPPKGGTPAPQGQLASHPVIPAIGDANSIRWALGKKVDDTLEYIDERGNEFKIRIAGQVANSILQGSLIIDERAFVERFPGEAGYRMFLIDVPSNSVAEVSATLSRALQDVGLELTKAPERLAAFNAVQNTYLSTFQVLGGLGLLIGTAGLGVVVLRNVLERRSELGLLTALGYEQGLLHRLVLSEHFGLLGLGLAIGIVAALAAITPFLFLGRGGLPYSWLALTLGAVLLVGLVSTVLATLAALRGNLPAALRNE